jgi:cobalt-zinc-cadmium efflux system membrane fusion protein
MTRGIARPFVRLHQQWLSVAPLLAGAAAVALVGAACSSCSASKAQSVPEGKEGSIGAPLGANAQVATGAVEQHDVARTIVSSARIAFDESRVAHVWSPVTGRVTRILVDLGQQVKKGQPLAVITTPDLGNALADLEKARVQVAQAGKELQRQKELFAAHAGSQRDLENAQAAYDQAVAERSRAEQKARLLTARAGGSVSQTFTLAAPIDGEVIARQINPGVEVQGQYSGGASVELFTIGKLDRVWALADVYEQDIARVKLGAPVQFKLVAYPDQVFTGKVDWISGTLDAGTRTATIRCVMANPDRLLKPQMYATAQIETDGHKALAIPRSSLLHMGEKTLVVSVNNGHYERRPVIVDEDETGDWVPVLHGLEAGENVVTSGALLLSSTLN